MCMLWFINFVHTIWFNWCVAEHVWNVFLHVFSWSSTLLIFRWCLCDIWCLYSFTHFLKKIHMLATHFFSSSIFFPKYKSTTLVFIWWWGLFIQYWLHGWKASRESHATHCQKASYSNNNESNPCRSNGNFIRLHRNEKLRYANEYCIILVSEQERANSKAVNWTIKKWIDPTRFGCVTVHAQSEPASI